MTRLARTVHVDPSINDYVSRLVDATRSATEVRLGGSVRAALALVRTAKTLAAASGRHYVVPDDIKTMAPDVLAHRIVLRSATRSKQEAAEAVIRQVLDEVPVPAEETLGAR